MGKKNLKVLVVSSKGGVGKSTLSMQIIAPYLYMKNNHTPIKFYEFDDENIDSLSYGGSSLTIREPIDVEEYILMNKFIEILSSDKSCCIDVGGNKSTSLCLEVLYDCGIGHEIDFALIPLLDGEQDAINAKKIYNKLKQIDQDMKILFALNKVYNPKHIHEQFENYFGDIRGIFDDKDAIVNHIDTKDSDNYITIPHSDMIKYSRKFGTTIFEIVSSDKDFDTEFKAATKEKEKKLVSFKHYVYQNCKKYYQNTLQPCFEKLDNIVKG